MVADLSKMDFTLLLFNLGGGEIIIILLVILILFGGKGIPSIAKTLGKSVREFKDAASGIQREITNGMNEAEREVNEQVQDVKKRMDTEHIDD